VPPGKEKALKLKDVRSVKVHSSRAQQSQCIFNSCRSIQSYDENIKKWYKYASTSIYEKN